MEKIKPLIKTFTLGLVSLITVLALVIIPLMTCGKVAKAAGTDSYLLLEYIETNGTQYIDTGFVPNANMKWVMDWKFNNTNNSVMGVYDNTGSALLRVYMPRIINNGNFQSLFMTTAPFTSTADTNRHTFIMDIKNSVSSIDGQSGSIPAWEISDNKGTLKLFVQGSNYSIDPNTFCYGRFYSSQIYDNGVLARDFVPAKRSSDGEIGLLDRVNGVFYTNQGTGTFTAGYLANDYYVCDYTQSTGSQYIDSGVTPSLNDAIVFSGKLDSTSNSYTGLMGANYNGRFYVMSNTSNFTFGVTDFQVYTSQSVDTNKHTFMVDNLLQIYSIDNSSTSYTAGNGYPKSSYMIHAVNNPSIDKSYSKIYSAQIFTNHTLVRNMIPVYDPSTNQAGMWDNINGVWYGNAGTDSFGYSITGGGTVYAVSTENALNSALTASVAGDIIALSDNIAISSQSITVGAAPLYYSGTYTLSVNRTNGALYTFDGWYSTKWTSKLTATKMQPNTTYYARFLATVSSGSVFALILGNPLDGDIINISSGFTYDYSSFTVPVGMTINLNGNTILPPNSPPMTQIGFNSDPSATTASSSFTAGNTYYAIYSRPSYSATLKVNSSATVDLTQLPAGATRGPSSTTGLDDITFTYTYGDSITFPNPVLTYYSFNGWYSNNQGPYSGINPTDYGVKVYEARWVTAPVIEIGNVKIFQNLSGTFSNDRLILFTYNITWGDYTPAYNVNTLFVFRLMDEAGTNTLMTTQVSTMGPNGGYEMGMGAFYFPDDSIIDWGEEYQIRIDGNPSMWYTISDLRAIYNITPANYTEASGHSENQIAAGNEILSIYLNLEENWQGIYRLVTTTTEGNMVLTSGLGVQYTLDILPNAMSLVPDIFTNKSTEHNPSELPNDDNTGIKNEPPELIQRWENQYDGTWVQTSFQALGDLFHVSWRLVTSLMCVALWVVLAAISQRRWGTTDAGMWAGAVVIGIGTTMGIMEWSIVGAAAILLALYGLYIVFWRQG